MFKVFPWIYQVLLLPLFEKIGFEKQYQENIAEAQKKGLVVYTIKTNSVIAMLYFNFVALRWNLPLADYVWGISPWRINPFKAMARMFGKIYDEPESPEDACRRGANMMIFLRTDKEIFPGFVKDPFISLVEEVRSSGANIQVVPQVFLFDRMPKEKYRSIWAQVTGVREKLGFITEWITFLRSYRRTVIRVAKPFDLTDFVNQNESMETERLAKKARLTLNYHLTKEEEIVRGPVRKGARLIKRLGMRDRNLQLSLKEHCKTSGITEEKAWKKVSRYFTEIAADLNLTTISYFCIFLEWMLDKIYDGMTFDEKGLVKLESLLKTGSVVLCPSHKSHMDYLLISFLLYRKKIIPPLIAAGKNLSFWPLGVLFRYSGAFFLRRTFKGNLLYSMTFKTYIKEVLKAGYPIEFFIEGTRSRTGKPLTPKFGLLDMLLEASSTMPSRKVYFVPVCIDYELLVEQNSYSKELGGGEKKKESVMELLRSINILKKRYGKVHIQFDEAIDVDSFLSESGQTREVLKSKETRKEILPKMGFRVVEGFTRANCVTPSSLVATVLLEGTDKAIDENSFLERSLTILGFLDEYHDSLNLIPALKSDPLTIEHRLKEMGGFFAQQGMIRIYHSSEGDLYNIPEDQRIAISFYRNNLINKFVPFAISSLAMEFEDPYRISEGLSSIFKYEYIFQSDKEHKEYLESMIDFLKSDKFAAMDPSGYMKKLFMNIMQADVEAYISMMDLICNMGALNGAREQKDLIGRGIEHCKTRYYFGTNLRSESANKSSLQNCLNLLKDRGCLSLKKDQAKRREKIYLLENKEKLTEYFEFLKEILKIMNRKADESAEKSA